MVRMNGTPPGSTNVKVNGDIPKTALTLSQPEIVVNIPEIKFPKTPAPKAAVINVPETRVIMSEAKKRQGKIIIKHSDGTTSTIELS